MKLFIVESPGKIKTIQSILPKDFIVKASVGHCFQIERSDYGIDVNNNYTPKYVPIKGKQKVIEELKKLAKEADEIYIATDGDREGESIGAHIVDKIIKDENKIKRVIFQEITKPAILKALKNPTTINRDLYNAQQARSVLDMLVGFRISPVLWTKVKSGTSAGRVQSIGLRYIVERQREIDAFKPEEYWSIGADFLTPNNEVFRANYSSDIKITNEVQAKEIEGDVKKTSDWYVSSITKSTKDKTPYPVFNTSTLQQFCSSAFGWDGKVTMSLAQTLYESGYISYHRTDSLNISEEAIKTVRDFIDDKYGGKYLPSSPRLFKSKNKVAQEAHEGIRPTHLEIFDEVKSLGSQEFKLYEAIYTRFIACQMADAKIDTSKVTIKSKSKHTFVANGQIVKFDGYLKVWKHSSTKDEELPALSEKDNLKAIKVIPEQHFTKPPAAYNTASLVKVLEEQGIGRPSTYASIIDTLIKREYITKDGKAFKPTDLGCKICDFLTANFQELMDAKYTARIEEQLDEIANGEIIWYKAVDDFFQEIKKRIAAAKHADSMKKKEETQIICPTCKVNHLIRREGKYGEFFGCAGYMIKGKGHCAAMFKIGPDGNPVTTTQKKDVRYLEGVKCDKCGSKIIIRTSTKTGKEFGGCSGFPKCKRMFSMEGEPIELKNKFKGKKNAKKKD